jgi:hypothetical protein
MKMHQPRVSLPLAHPLSLTKAQGFVRQPLIENAGRLWIPVGTSRKKSAGMAALQRLGFFDAVPAECN